MWSCECLRTFHGGDRFLNRNLEPFAHRAFGCEGKVQRAFHPKRHVASDGLGRMCNDNPCWATALNSGEPLRQISSNADLTEPLGRHNVDAGCPAFFAARRRLPLPQPSAFFGASMFHGMADVTAVVFRSASSRTASPARRPFEKTLAGCPRRCPRSP